ncbi:proto-oncogene Mas-like [Erythrolamprus reginae]|uniref:proto-oncogene Mas-like n=1 Tax=Erythrolamprus reginae TaxID=121349 RepID=UPI00396C7AC4
MNSSKQANNTFYTMEPPFNNSKGGGRRGAHGPPFLIALNNEHQRGSHQRDLVLRLGERPVAPSGDSSYHYQDVNSSKQANNTFCTMEQTFNNSKGNRSTHIIAYDFPQVWIGYDDIRSEFLIPRSRERVPELIDFPFNATEIVSNVSIIPEFSPYDHLFDNVTRNLLNGFFALICIFGLVGNGATIYLLAFSIKRNPFTTFILNLSIADFGVITSLVVSAIFVSVFTLSRRTYVVNAFFLLFFEFFSFTYSASQFLLTAISLDRCVAVLFPLWHRCHRPPYLSTLVCSLIWILSFLLSALHFILHQTRTYGSSPVLYQLIVNGLLCTPLMVASTVILWIHMRSMSQRNQRKLLTTILLALLFFLLLSLPLNVFYAIEHFHSPNLLLMTFGIGCATLNSSINPLLYFLVGRKKGGKGQTRASYKVALQRVFKNEKSSPEDHETTNESQL